MSGGHCNARGADHPRLPGRAPRACAPDNRRPILVTPPMPPDSWTIDEASLAAFTRALAGPPADPAWAALRERAEAVALVPGFDRLITIASNAVEELPHQLRVAQQVLRAPMGGRAILADEV